MTNGRLQINIGNFRDSKIGPLIKRYTTSKKRNLYDFSWGNLDYSLPKKPYLLNVWSYLSKDNKKHSIFITYILQLRKKPELLSPEKLDILWMTKKDISRKKAIKDKEFVKKIFHWRRKNGQLFR